MLKPQPKGPDGTYRAWRAELISGQVVGPFSYGGMRADDPNDTFRIRTGGSCVAWRVFAAWLNHHDTKAINSMDSLVEEDGRLPEALPAGFRFHPRQRGCRAESARGPGTNTRSNGKATLVQMATFGFYVPRWARAGLPASSPGCG